MYTVWSSQYNINCVVPERGDTASQIIERCWHIAAVMDEDGEGEQFCVQLRDEIGPQLWSEDALRGSWPLTS